MLWWLIFGLALSDYDPSRRREDVVTALTVLANLSNCLFLLVDPLTKYFLSADYARGTITNDLMKVSGFPASRVSQSDALFLISLCARHTSAVAWLSS